MTSKAIVARALHGLGIASLLGGGLLGLLAATGTGADGWSDLVYATVGLVLLSFQGIGTAGSLILARVTRVPMGAVWRTTGILAALVSVWASYEIGLTAWPNGQGKLAVLVGIIAVIDFAGLTAVVVKPRERPAAGW